MILVSGMEWYEMGVDWKKWLPPWKVSGVPSFTIGVSFVDLFPFDVPMDVRSVLDELPR